MNPNELLNIANNSSTVAYHRFVLLSNGRKNDLFCFLEGNDCHYYSLRIKQYTKKVYHPISCGNKSSVIETYHLIHKNNLYNSYTKAFFVDSDFDESLNIPDIFETPCYSIENLYVQKDTLIEILKNEFGLIETDHEFKKSIEFFENELSLFMDKTLLFNAWYATLKKEKKKRNLSSTGVNLCDKLPDSFLCLKIGNITADYDIIKILNHFPKAIHVDINDIDKTISELREKELSLHLRGKFQMWFFCTYINYLIEDANNDKLILKKKTKFRVERSQILSQISQYASTPDSLMSYLNRFN